MYHAVYRTWRCSSVSQLWLLEVRLRRSSGTTVSCNIKSVMYHVFCLFPPPFLFKIETNLFNPGGSIDLISSESMSPVLCSSSWGRLSRLNQIQKLIQLPVGENISILLNEGSSALKMAQIFRSKSNSFETLFLMSLVNGTQGVYHIACS